MANERTHAERHTRTYGRTQSGISICTGYRQKREETKKKKQNGENMYDDDSDVHRVENDATAVILPM